MAGKETRSSAAKTNRPLEADPRNAARKMTVRPPGCRCGSHASRTGPDVLHSPTGEGKLRQRWLVWFRRKPRERRLNLIDRRGHPSVRVRTFRFMRHSPFVKCPLTRNSLHDPFCQIIPRGAHDLHPAWGTLNLGAGQRTGAGDFPLPTSMVRNLFSKSCRERDIFWVKILEEPHFDSIEF